MWRDVRIPQLIFTTMISTGKHISSQKEQQPYRGLSIITDRGGLLFIVVTHVECNITKLIKRLWKMNGDIYGQIRVLYFC
jgi:hypothetical protein